MEKYEREYTLFSLCGLNCGLCPNHYTNGTSRCPGCGGENFFNPSCGIVSCAKRNGGLQYCFLCGEYPCKKYEGADAFDSFISHRNQMSDNERARILGLDEYKAQLNEKVEILKVLLDSYNDGRKKSFFCLAVNLLELPDIRQVLAALNERAAPETLAVKERAAIAESLFKAMAQERSISLKLQKKTR